MRSAIVCAFAGRALSKFPGHEEKSYDQGFAIFHGKNAEVFLNTKSSSEGRLQLPCCFGLTDNP